MDLYGNNISEEIAYFRDTFLNAEKDYLNELLKDEKNVEFVNTLNRKNAEELCDKAKELINLIETGQVREEDLEDVEAQITLTLAAIQDCVNLREHVPSEKEEENEDDYDKKLIERIRKNNKETIRLFNEIVLGNKGKNSLERDKPHDDFER